MKKVFIIFVILLWLPIVSFADVHNSKQFTSFWWVIIEAEFREKASATTYSLVQICNQKVENLIGSKTPVYYNTYIQQMTKCMNQGG